VKNAELAAARQVPLCQDTGYVWVGLEVSGPLSVPADVFSLVDAAVATVYEQADLRMSLVKDALMNRVNTGNNTPAFCDVTLLPPTQPCAAQPLHNQHASSLDTTLDDDPEAARAMPQAILHVMLKGGGSDNASTLTMLPPAAGLEGVVECVLDSVRSKGAGACPPLLVGVGVGSNFGAVASLSKQALLRPIGSPNPQPELADLEARLLADINATGIGAGGLGGSTTALAVHVKTAPCHIAALPVAVNLGCCALRSTSVRLV
ncbi:MAG: fumarate hydratase, partial [Coriobacteriales bacterium]|nr:fumarate hydratase [Coriobacteriales bacterium]